MQYNTNRIIIGFMLSIMLLLGGCTTTQPQKYVVNTNTLSMYINTLDTTYTKVKYLLAYKQEQDNIFTASEWNDLLEVEAAIKLLLLKYNTIINMGTVTFDTYDISLMWDITKTSYAKARKIVIVHLDSFNGEDQNMFKSFDDQAILAYSEIDKLLDNPTSNNMSQVATLVVTVLTLAVKILSITVI